MKSKNQKSTQHQGANKAAPENLEEKKSDYPHELEQSQSGSDISYSEEHDVTPPNPHEPPSFGNAETDFVSAGNHGRKTSRMIDHEPGL